MSDATPLFTDAELATQAQGNASVLAYLLAHLSKTWRHTPAEAALAFGGTYKVTVKRAYYHCPGCGSTIGPTGSRRLGGCSRS